MAAVPLWCSEKMSLSDEEAPNLLTTFNTGNQKQYCTQRSDSDVRRGHSFHKVTSRETRFLPACCSVIGILCAQPRLSHYTASTRPLLHTATLSNNCLGGKGIHMFASSSANANQKQTSHAAQQRRLEACMPVHVRYGVSALSPQTVLATGTLIPR